MSTKTKTTAEHKQIAGECIVAAELAAEAAALYARAAKLYMQGDAGGIADAGSADAIVAKLHASATAAIGAPPQE
jgi:hypothetical protein